MGKSRAPEIDEDGLARFSKRNDRDLFALRNRFLQYEDLHKDNEITRSYIALEAMTALLGGRLEGYSDADMQGYWPEAWGAATVALPASLVKEIAKAWMEYKQDEKGRTFGEALGLEGGGQGRQRAITAQRKRDQLRHYAREVILIYTGTPETADPPSLSKSIDQVAARNGVSFETVQEAYKKFRDQIIGDAQHANVLKGGRTS